MSYPVIANALWYDQPYRSYATLSKNRPNQPGLTHLIKQNEILTSAFSIQISSWVFMAPWLNMFAEHSSLNIMSSNFFLPYWWYPNQCKSDTRSLCGPANRVFTQPWVTDGFIDVMGLTLLAFHWQNDRNGFHIIVDSFCQTEYGTQRLFNLTYLPLTPLLS